MALKTSCPDRLTSTPVIEFIVASSPMSAPATNALLPRPGQDDTAHGVVIADPVERLTDLSDDLRVEGIQLVLPIDGDDRELVVALDLDVRQIAHGKELRKAWSDGEKGET